MPGAPIRVDYVDPVKKNSCRTETKVGDQKTEVGGKADRLFSTTAALEEVREKLRWKILNSKTIRPLSTPRWFALTQWL